MSISKIKEYLVPLDIGHKLIRYGPKFLKSIEITGNAILYISQDGDGGYVLSQECVEEANVVYSLGVEDNTKIDRELADMGKSIYMYDINTPDKSVISHKNFYFKEMEVDAQKLTDEIQMCGHTNDNNMLLNIDIETEEYLLFEKISEDVLLKFSQICVELHEVVSAGRTQQVLNFLKKMAENYYLVHIHANNVIYHRPEILHRRLVDGMPDILELTYVRKDKCNIEPVPITSSCPIEGLDFPNVNYKDVVLDWWCSSDE